MSTRFDNYLKDQGIIHQTTNPCTPELNARSERLDRTMIEKAPWLLYEAGLEKRVWAEAVNTACYLRNNSMFSDLSTTPHELFFGRKTDLGHIRVFRSEAMVHIPKEKMQKWDKKSKKLILVGFHEITKGYKLYNRRTGQISTSRDVHVTEKEKDTLTENKIKC